MSEGKSYDSTHDAQEHIKHVQRFLSEVIGDLTARQSVHDRSKLEEPEKSMYDEFTPKLRGTTYGSDEYRRYLEQMGLALKHHYEVNSHHPEHYANGIDGMTLMDLIEMLADWKAASMRHAGNFEQSLEVNRERFGISDQLFTIIVNSVRELGW